MDEGRNPDGPLKPAEIHLGDALVDEKANYVSFSHPLPSKLSVHHSKAKAAYHILG